MIIAHTKDGDFNLRCNELFIDEVNYFDDNTVLIDLLNIFLEIYINDISIKRVGSNARNILIKVFVDRKNIKIWESNSAFIENLCNFVTEGDGDKWTLSCIPSDYEYSAIKMQLDKSDVDNISLLSGGLDSFCGAYSNELSNRKTIYCGYKTSNVDTSAIKRISDFLGTRRGNMGVCTYEKVNVNKVTLTQRTRSLLFFSLAVITAYKEKVTNINVNENGIMTLNPSFQTRGTTKTTHPKTIYLYQQILNNANIKIKVNHPFLFKTKGEMVASLNNEYINFMKDTRSCSRSLHDVRYDVSSKKSCGTCVPCLLRKISVAAYNLENYDNDYIVSYKGDMADPEYRSSLFYFQTFYKSIKMDEIFSELRINKKYYEIDDYYEKTFEMLNRFAQEFEIFSNKYVR